MLCQQRGTGQILNWSAVSIQRLQYKNGHNEVITNDPWWLHTSRRRAVPKFKLESSTGGILNKASGSWELKISKIPPQIARELEYAIRYLAEREIVDISTTLITRILRYITF